MFSYFYLNRNNAILIFLAVFCVLSSTSCKKFLDAKPDQSLVVPTTLDDLQAILDRSSLMAEGTSFGEASADNYYVTENTYDRFNEEMQKAYIWENFSYSYRNDWARVYDVIFPSNLVLEELEKITPRENQIAEWNNLKGSALLFRALSLQQGAFIFCKAYDPSTAADDLGLVLRLKSDFNLPSPQRSSVSETYERIIGDLKQAAPLLPPSPIHPMRPSRAAAYGLLARTYMSMNNYDSCLKYSNLCLQIQDDLFDFNSLTDINALFAFPSLKKDLSKELNKEVIMMTLASQLIYIGISYSYGVVDTTLYASYSDNDLRKYAYFQPTVNGINFKGSYSGTFELFIGLATDEVFLMRAECYARKGEKEAALADLNRLLASKFETATFVPLEAASAIEALNIILAERRKELIFRNLRWMDIKRLNLMGANIVLTRKIRGEMYQLMPNDNRYALPLPEDIIRMTGIAQNPR